MGFKDKFMNAIRPEGYQAKELVVHEERYVSFVDLDPQEKAMFLLRAANENLGNIEANQQHLESVYLPKIHGFTKAFGGDIEPERAKDAALFYGALLEKWTKNKETLEKYKALIDYAKREQAVAQNAKRECEQQIIWLNDERKRLDLEVGAGRLNEINDERREERDPTPEKGFKRLQRNLGHNAMVRNSQNIESNLERSIDILKNKVPALEADIQEKIQRVDALRMELSKYSDNLNILKKSFDNLYTEHTALMASFNEQIRGLFGEINQANSGMLPPVPVMPGDTMPQIEPPLHLREIVSSTAVDATSKIESGNFLGEATLARIERN